MIRMLPRRFPPAVLAICSAALLLVGARIHIGSPGPPAPSVGTVLERRLEAGAAPALARELYGRAIRFANQLTWVSASKASGVRWQSSEAVVTTSASGTPPVARVMVPGGGPPVRDIFRGDPQPGEWLVVVGRTADGRLVWTAGMYGGKTMQSCGGATFGQLQLSAALTDAYAGAAVIDRNMRFVGLVVRCGTGAAAMSVDGIDRALALPSVAGLNESGFRAMEIPPELRSRFDRRGSWIVTAVRDGTPAAEAGLQAGDVLAAPEPDAGGLLTVYQDRRPLQIRVAALHATVQGIEVESAAGGLKVASVEPESPGAQAGIRPGDLIIRAGSASADPDRLVAALNGSRGPVFTVVRREDRAVGVFLP